ncbi:MAG TPA: chemotaxis protein CheB [Rhizomicrobium sp.]|jgi:chemotaxis response regulator CheB
MRAVCAMTTGSGFPIIGVGASAGGIQALEGLFKGMPTTPGVGIVIVTHLNPDRESVLLGSRRNSMKRVAHSCVYQRDDTKFPFCNHEKKAS